MYSNLYNDILSITKNALSNKQVIVSSDISQSRLDICESCENFNNDTCNICGCFMPAKVKFAPTKCPIDKWGIIEEP